MILAMSGFYQDFWKKAEREGKQKGSAFSSDRLLWQTHIPQLKIVIDEPGYITANETCKLWAKLSLISSNVGKQRYFQRLQAAWKYFPPFQWLQKVSGCLLQNPSLHIQTRSPSVSVIIVLVPAIWVWRLFSNRASVIYIKYSTDYGLERSWQVQHSNTWRYWFYTFLVILHHVPLVSGNLYNFYTDINCDKKGIK